MPQIAQQDYLVVEIQNPESLTAEEMSRLRELHRRGVLLDAVIKTNGFLYRVVSDELFGTFRRVTGCTILLEDYLVKEL